MEAQSPTTPEFTPTPVVKASSSNKIMVLINLILRIFVFIFLLIALIVLATDTGVLVTDIGNFSVHFHDSISYRYMMATIVIGLVYALVQIGFTIYQLITGRSLFDARKPIRRFDFYADKALSGLLATAASAGFAASIELKPVSPSLGDFFDKGNATASLVLFAFLLSEASQIISFHVLSK